MRWHWKAWVAAIAATAAFPLAPGAAARTASTSQMAAAHGPKKLHRNYVRTLPSQSGRIGRLHRVHGGLRGRRSRFADLVGDPDSGLGFYPLPMKYRIGAWHHHLRNQAPPWQNPVLFAIAADAARYYNWYPGYQGYHYGVFDPVEGFGTPFFAGFYGPAGDDDEDRPFPFGRPYPK